MSKQRWTQALSEIWVNIRGSLFDEEGGSLLRREKIVVFLFSYGIALVLWLLVNLSRPFNLTVTLPVTLESVPAGQALAQSVPREANVNISGEGWKLLRIYNNPPHIRLRPVAGTMNFFDVVREQMNMFAGLEVTKVSPPVIDISLEKRTRKKVPVRPEVKLTPMDQYGVVGQPMTVPDSVTLMGAPTVLQKIDYWPTEKATAGALKKDLTLKLNVRKPGEILEVSPSMVTLYARVEEFTEGEVTVPITTSSMPGTQRISYSPPRIKIRYAIPIREYSAAQDQTLFQASVPYEDILNDTTGFVAPLISLVSDSLHLRVRTYQPHRVAYYRLVH